MRGGGARSARLLLALSIASSLTAVGASAAAQNLAPEPAAPVPVPEQLAPSSGEAGRASSAERVEPSEPSRPAPATREGASVAVSADASPLSVGGKATDLKYLLQSVEVVGNRRTRTTLIKSFVPIDTGAALDVNDPEIEALRYRLLGTGWYDRVELSLKRGSQPGWAILVIEVEERSTLVFQQLAAGVGWSVEGVRGLEGDDREPGRVPEPYLGLALADTNLLGTGRTLSAEVLASPDQQGISFGFFTPVVRSSLWSLRLRASLVKGREYFGGDRGVRVTVSCSDPRISPEERESCELEPPVAVVEYWRTGFGIGTSRDVGTFTRISLEWRHDFVNVPPGGMPVAASELRGRPGYAASRVPIDFSIEPDLSYVSMLTVGLVYDKRDNAILPSRGTLAGFNGDLASGLVASDYGFMRVQANYHHWFALPWGHTIRAGVFAGALFGYAPFFYKFFVSDLSDLQPTRILGLSLDHRPAPNLLGTSIVHMRQEELAARIDAEYVWPLVRGRRKFLKSADAFAMVGLYSLADTDDLRVALPGYEGFSRFPVDLTLDAGVRLDTHIGVFQIGVAKLFWLPWR